MFDILEIEDILYDGTKEDIEKILKEYKISFSYNSNNFSFESKKLSQISRGIGGNKKPNCVLYFGSVYKYNNDYDK